MKKEFKQAEIVEVKAGDVMDKKCGTCKYHQYEKHSQGWVCCNPDSEYRADWTEFDDWCDEYEEMCVEE